MANQSFPKPKRYFSESFLKHIWKESKDSKGAGAVPGIDGVNPKEFKNLINFYLPTIVQKLRTANYSFSPLRPIPISKGQGSNKYRIICVPTVEDRLVQRAIKEILEKNSKVKRIKSSISYGVHSGREWSTWAALKEASRIRSNKRWVFKTDIQSFFDSVDRGLLKNCVNVLLGKSSLVPLLNQVIDTEISSSVDYSIKQKIGTTKIKKGLGLRQGMPLSPLLSNILLVKFDQSIIRQNIPLLRYVDDIIAFGDTKDEVERIHKIVHDELRQLNLDIPDLDDKSKTVFANPEEPVEFLGIEIALYGQDYKFRVPKTAIEGALQEIRETCSIKNIRERNILYKDLVILLEQMKSGYTNYYKSQCENFDSFVARVKETSKNELKSLLQGFVGEELFKVLPQEAKTFLEIDF